MYTHPHHMGGGWVPPHMIGLDHSLSQQHGLYHHSTGIEHSSTMNGSMYYDMDAVNTIHQQQQHQDITHMTPPITRHDIQSSLLIQQQQQQPTQTKTLPPVSQALAPGTATADISVCVSSDNILPSDILPIPPTEISYPSISAASPTY